MVVTHIVSETSLSEGDMNNALISMSNIVCDALKTPKIIFPQAEDARCRQQRGIEHRPRQREGFHGWRYYDQSGRGCNGNSVGLRRDVVAAALRPRPAAASRGFNEVIIFKKFELCTKRDRIRRRLVGGLNGMECYDKE